MAYSYIERRYRISDPHRFVKHVIEDPTPLLYSYRDVVRDGRKTHVIGAEFRVGDRVLFRGDIVVFREIYRPLEIVLYSERGEVIHIGFRFDRGPGTYFMRVRLSGDPRGAAVDISYLKELADYLEEMLIVLFSQRYGIRPVYERA